MDSHSKTTRTSDANVVLSARHRSTGFPAQLEEVSARLCRADILVWVLLLGFGALHIFFSEPRAEFFDDDVFNTDAGRSLIEHGFYGVNGYLETNMPPGLSVILGFLCVLGACGHAVALRAMAAFEILGFLVSYELLRRQAPRCVAAAICLLLISSRIYFDLATQWVCASYPYFFTATCALLAARKLQDATRLTSRIIWGTLMAAFVTASLLFASVAIAFLGGIAATICVIFFRDRRLAFASLRTYLAVLLVGIAVQGLWMHSATVPASAGIGAEEWPVSGFPNSYLAQLKVKDGNYPELGLATPSDIAIRFFANAASHANLLSRLLLRRLPQVAWMSVLVSGLLILVAVGWLCSLRRPGGGLQEWYFAGYEFIYLLWPWHLETRFFLPVAPLACLYLWRGGEVLIFLAKDKPRVFGMMCFPTACVLTVASWFWMRGAGVASHFPNTGLEDELSFSIWLFLAILGAWMVWADTAWLRPVLALSRLCSGSIGAQRINPLFISKALGTIVVIGLIVIGLTIQVQIGRDNLDLHSPRNRPSPDGEAGVWIRSHTDSDAVVMARHVPIFYHNSQRKVVWFPPSSVPQLLMEGILKHKIDFVVVVKREYSYYLPTDDDCFAPLLAAYPDAFRLAYQTPDFRIFQVVKNAALPSENAPGVVH